jgi:Histidine kinase-like ATPase domain
VVSELSSNALRHSASGAPGGKFAVAIGITEDGVVLHVRDQGPLTTPGAGNGTGSADGDSHGQGLAVVATVSAAWGTEPAAACSLGDPADPAVAGRCTWCRLPDSPDPEA